MHWALPAGARIPALSFYSVIIMCACVCGLRAVKKKADFVFFLIPVRLFACGFLLAQVSLLPPRRLQLPPSHPSRPALALAKQKVTKRTPYPLGHRVRIPFLLWVLFSSASLLFSFPFVLLPCLPTCWLMPACWWMQACWWMPGY